jgi:hypothetical protein
VDTKSAFVYGGFFFVDIAGVIRAGHHAVLAADADIVINQHQPILPAIGRPGGADSLAGWVGAVVAVFRQKGAAEIREDAPVYFVDPVPMHTQWHFVLDGAGDHAGFAVDAAFRFHHKYPAALARGRIVITHSEAPQHLSWAGIRGLGDFSFLFYHLPPALACRRKCPQIPAKIMLLLF